jgi:hypothetical protein
MARLHEVLPAGFNANVIELTFRGRAAGNPHGTN